MTYYIAYKFDPCRLKVVLKPNIRYWRFRYWLNQYVALITWFIIWPIVKLNGRCGRLQAGDEINSLCEIYRMGMLVVPESKAIHLVCFPWWIKIGKKLFKKSMLYWKTSLSSPRVYEGVLIKKDLKYYMSLNYDVEIQKLSEDDGGGYLASIPQLGAKAFCGDGDTPEKAVEELNKVKKFLFQDYLKNGQIIVEPWNKEINIFERYENL